MEEDHTRYRSEPEAQDFANTVLMDGGEGTNNGLTNVGEAAGHFGMPEEFVRLQAPLV